jgi:dihydrodipicolinate synthase/N-acetylneuraminate lyase
VTPLKAGDTLDVAALERLIGYVGMGPEAFLVGDVFWGEGLALTADTRADMVEATLGLVKERRPVFVTVTSRTEDDTVALLEKMKVFIQGSGCSGDVYWVDYPIYYHSNRGLPQFYEKMGRDSAVPFVLANHPGLVVGRKNRTRQKNIRTSVLKKLSGIDGVQGLIFSGSLKRAINYQKAVRHRGDFRLFDGDEATFMKQPSSDGVVAGGANLLPKAWHEVTWSCLNRYDVERQYPDHVRQIWEAGVMVQAFQRLYATQPAAVLKRMLHVAGILPNAHTASGTPCTSPTQNQSIETICRTYDLI